MEKQFLSKTLYMQCITYLFHFKLTEWGTESLTKDLNRLHDAYV